MPMLVQPIPDTGQAQGGCESLSCNRPFDAGKAMVWPSAFLCGNVVQAYRALPFSVYMSTERTVLSDASWQEPQLARTQEQYLRTLAFAMPWFLRPPESTGLQIADFAEYARQKLVQIFQSASVPALRGQDLSERRRALRHICFRLIEESRYMLTHGEKPEAIAGVVRKDLQHICTHKELLIPHQHHPLYTDGRAHTEERGGREFKIIAANTDDRKLAEWVKDTVLPQWLESLPGLSQKSPNIRLIEYARAMRNKLRSLIQGYELAPYGRFNDKQRSELLDVILDEWVSMANQMNLDTRALALVQEMKPLEGILDASPDEVAARLDVDALVRTREDEAKINPLLQQIVLRLTSEKDGLFALEQISTAWAVAQMRLGIASCDRPATALAALAAIVRYPDTSVGTVLNRL